VFKDPVFFKTLQILLAIFAIILGFTIFFDLRNRRLKKYTGLGELWKRYLSFCIITPIFLYFSYKGKPLFNFLIIVMASLYLREFFKISKLWQYKIYRWEGRIFSALILLATLFKEKFLFYRVPLIVLVVILATPVFLRRPQDALRQTSATIVGILYFGWMFSYIIFLRESFGFGGVIAVCILVTLNDIFCYWVGKILGKHKLIPSISPNKTIEGALGGLILTSFSALLFKYALIDLSYVQLFILGALISILGQIGDLVISVIKRDMGIKDTGKILPGHGGMLDRFDSWIFTLPFVYFFLHLFK